MNKPQLSVRLTKEARMVFGREIIRLTINPVLLSLSTRFVDWSGHRPVGKKETPSGFLKKARRRFPRLPLSWAVEGYIALLLSAQPELTNPFSVEPLDELDESIRRFSALSPAAKIRTGLRWKRELVLLRGAR